MSCTVVNSQSQVKSRLPALPANPPTTPAAWQQLVSTLNLWGQALQQDQHPPNVIPGQFQLFTAAGASTTIGAMTAVNCTPSVDTAQTYYGASSLKVVIASSGATLSFAGTPISISAASRWFCAFQVYAPSGMTGSLTVSTNAPHNITNELSVPASASWQQVWALFDFSQFPDTQATWEFLFTSTATVWIDGLQMNTVGSLLANLPQFAGGAAGQSVGTSGPAGPAGANGTRGSKQFYGTASAWSDSAANAVITAAGFSVVTLDSVTLSDNVSFAETKFWDGSAWQLVTAVIDGNLLVNGTVAASKIDVTLLSAISADLGTVTAGTVIFDNGTYEMVQGIGFGANSDLIWWFGPHQASIAKCSKSNAINYLGVDGSSQWGGGVNSSILATKHTFTSSGTETIPSGKSTLVAELWGPTGYGGLSASPGNTQGGGGGSAGYCRTVLDISALGGKTFTVTITGSGTTTASTIAAGTVTGFTTMSAPGGGNGASSSATVGGGGGSAGATASGGNVANTQGFPGAPGFGTVTGGSDGSGGSAVPGVNASGPAGAHGSVTSSTVPGSNGLAVFYYT